jgi:hypothetical protein
MFQKQTRLIEFIETKLGNQIISNLKQDGWKIIDQYDAEMFDKGIDFDSYTLKLRNKKLVFEWDNWLEWKVNGDKQTVDQLEEKYQLHSKIKNNRTRS